MLLSTNRTLAEPFAPFSIDVLASAYALDTVAQLLLTAIFLMNPHAETIQLATYGIAVILLRAIRLCQQRKSSDACRNS